MSAWSRACVPNRARRPSASGPGSVIIEPLLVLSIQLANDLVDSGRPHVYRHAAKRLEQRETDTFVSEMGFWKPVVKRGCAVMF